MTPPRRETTTRAGTASDVRNLEGRAQAFTILTPVKPGWALWLRCNFFVGRHVPYLTMKLRRLSFIHYARWSIIKLRPGNRPQPSGGTRKYLLVTTNFNGTWDQYVEVFSEVVPWRIRGIWSSAPGFPGPSPPERLKEFVRENELAADHYYAAYPQATATVVLAALELRDKFERFAHGMRHDADGDEFRQAWLAFLTQVQGHL
jgi:hypothetical protein